MGQWKALLEAVNDSKRATREGDPIPLLRKILGALADRTTPSQTAVRQLERILKGKSNLLTLNFDGKTFEWILKSGRSEALRDAFLVRQAEDLLVHEDLSRLKRCEGDGCPILFVDESKNQSRRWCSMEHCGMLLKSKRYYDAHRRRK